MLVNIYNIEKKSEVFDYFRDLQSLVERETKTKIKWLKSDGGKEYFSGKINSISAGEGNSERI